MKHDASKRQRPLKLEPETWRLPDRGRRYFGGRRILASELSPVGRPNDIYGDVLVTLARVRAMEEVRRHD